MLASHLRICFTSVLNGLAPLAEQGTMATTPELKPSIVDGEIDGVTISAPGASDPVDLVTGGTKVDVNTFFILICAALVCTAPEHTNCR